MQQEFRGLVYSGEHQGPVIDTIAAGVVLVTSGVVAIFDIAEKIARQTHPSANPEIGSHHLFAALLLRDTHVKGVSGGPSLPFKSLPMISNVEGIRRRFYDFIVKSLPNDDHSAWRRLLIDQELTDAEPARSHAGPLEQDTVAGFMADEWTGDDLLGITQDVNALASLVAAYKVEPPLSIGLFGDWGSGKSHFMRQMKKRVEMLSRHARESGRPQRDLGYYKNIVQIEFNAWHYIEGNLWASLVDHIFANLKLSEREP
ncbi:MAG TPA: P-loop NTPase fold protein, partial [Pyrinomonadaceae bacterium]|nr:P-loop NTPase fold protein [Pyrinomonadaceae bacterium]